MDTLPEGTRITVRVKSSDGVLWFDRHGIVKFTNERTGWTFYYCDPARSNGCRMCGPNDGNGAHRIGSSGSYLINPEGKNHG